MHARTQERLDSVEAGDASDEEHASIEPSAAVPTSLFTPERHRES